MVSDRFSELSDLESDSREQQADRTDDDSDDDTSVGSQSESTAASEAAPTQAQPDETSSTAESTGDIHETAFNYDEAKQSPIYARPSAWDEYDDALELDVERSLRTRDVRNASKRELHDATLRLAAENPELVAEKLLEARRES